MLFLVWGYGLVMVVEFVIRNIVKICKSCISMLFFFVVNIVIG